MKIGLVSLLIVVATVSLVKGANILAIVPLPAKSHVNLFEPLVIALAERGHHVTYITSYNLKKPQKNVEEVILKNSHRSLDGVQPNFFDMRHFTAFHNMIFLPLMTKSLCNITLGSAEFQAVLKNGRKYDAIISEAFLTESIAAGLAHTLKAPLIGYATFMPCYWVNFWVGNEAPPSYIPDPFTNLPSKMTFPQRLWNSAFGLLANTFQQLVHMNAQDSIMREHFGNDLPHISNIIRNASLLLVNDHYALSFPRPAVPNLISIGGIHINPPKPLPADLKKYMDDAKNGAILFSFGSNLKSSELGPERIQMFINVFAKLKQNVLWKFETDMPNKPSNVLISDWLPQSDLLAHPNLKLFITHGGLLSTTEAVERGVPIVGIPIFGDQPMNMRQSVNAGVGVSLDFDTMTEENVMAAIQEVLNNPKYNEAAKARSRTLKDVPIPPRESAVWWVEYVIRHKGAPHLRSAAQDLTWYQRAQLDVIATLLVITVTLLYITKRVLAAICNKICGKKQTVSKNKKKN